MTDSLAAIAGMLSRDGFAFVRAPEMQALLETAGLRDWGSFAATWDDLGVDAYMADGGRYRRRRFAAFRAAAAEIVRKPHQPHYQSRDYNPLNGGLERWFEPVTEAVAHHPALTAILSVSRELFDRMTPAEVRPAAWHVELENIASGETTIYDLVKRPLGSFTLTAPLDAALVDDGRVYHGVTAVAPLDPLLPAYRDVLVVTFRRE